MSITVHFIDEKLQNSLTHKHFVPKSRTAAAVLDYFNDCIKSYQIPDSRLFTVASDSRTNMYNRGLFTIVTDSGSNMCGCSEFRSQYDWIACVGLKIATVLTTVLCKTTQMVEKTKSQPFCKQRDNPPKVFDLIDDCKALVRYIKQTNLKPELSKTLKQENVTRRGSHFRMMVNMMEMYDELATLLTARQKFSILNRQIVLYLRSWCSSLVLFNRLH